MSEFCLQDKIEREGNTSWGTNGFIDVEDVKECFRLLKEVGIITNSPNLKIKVLEIPLFEFNRIVGDKLTQEDKT